MIFTTTIHLAILLTTLLSILHAEEIITEKDIPEWKYLDHETNPCDNFYQYTCGNFQKFHPKPPGASIIDHFEILEDSLIKIGHEILSSPTQQSDPLALKKTKSAFRACQNSMLHTQISTPELQTVQEFGGMPLINSSDGWDFSWNDVGKMVGRYGIPLIFNVRVRQMSQDDFYIYLSSDPLGNPSLIRPKHRRSDEEIFEESFMSLNAKPSAPFDIFLQTLAKNILRSTNPSKSEDDILEDLAKMATFMRALYSGGLPVSTVGDLPQALTIEDLQTWTRTNFEDSKISWLDFLGEIFTPAGVPITSHLKIYHDGAQMIAGILNLVAQTDPRVVKNFAMLRIFLFQAPDSDLETRSAFEDYYRSRNIALYPRWEYCARKILDVVDTASLNFAPAYDYQRYHFNVNKLSQASRVVGAIRENFVDIVEGSDWLGSEARGAALTKAANMMVLMGFPEMVDDGSKLDRFYQNVEICEWDNYGNSQRIRAFKQAYQLAQLKKTDRAFWDKSIFQVNAFYNRPNNKMVVPVSILNPTFFHGNNTVVDYSRLGSIIGHEITHGFDDAGKNYDPEGKVAPWWSEETRKAFEERTRCFKEQYSRFYVPEIQGYVNGTTSINENLADNAGVKQSFRAFLKIVKTNKITSGSKKYSLEQLFFIGFGTMWCSVESPLYLQSLVSASIYSPNRFRVNGALSNMADFSKAFNCPIGSVMNPQVKCSLW